MEHPLPYIDTMLDTIRFIEDGRYTLYRCFAGSITTHPIEETGESKGLKRINLQGRRIFHKKSPL